MITVLVVLYACLGAALAACGLWAHARRCPAEFRFPAWDGDVTLALRRELYRRYDRLIPS